MTIDGTDFRIPQKGAATKGNAFASHKYAGKSALRYELGVDILAGNLVWIQGPYPAGKYTDIVIFNKVLRSDDGLDSSGWLPAMQNNYAMRTHVREELAYVPCDVAMRVPDTSKKRFPLAVVVLVYLPEVAEKTLDVRWALKTGRRHRRHIHSTFRWIWAQNQHGTFSTTGEDVVSL
jgi:hypothetical protein